MWKLREYKLIWELNANCISFCTNSEFGRSVTIASMYVWVCVKCTTRHKYHLNAKRRTYLVQTQKRKVYQMKFTNANTLNDVRQSTGKRDGWIELHMQGECVHLVEITCLECIFCAGCCAVLNVNIIFC